VEHRLAVADQACLEEALGRTRAAHLQIHLASATLAELLEGQSLAGVRTAQQQLQAAAAAASQALDALP